MPLDDTLTASGLDPVAIAQTLIRVPCVTPDSGAGIKALEAVLRPLGFACRRMDFGDTANLYAELRQGEGRNLCFAGHTDVVPPGDIDAWSVDPFAGEVRSGMLIGRGAADMKGAIAAFAVAVADVLAVRRESGQGRLPGAISFLITGDEEGPAHDGTQKALAALMADGVRLDGCIVGEPSSEANLGDIIKNGRRGSLNIVIGAEGRQGHVAYPHKAANPVMGLLDFINDLRAVPLDDGAEGFEPSRLEVTTIDAANPAHNVIAARVGAKANIRFNTRHTRQSLIDRLEAAASTFNALGEVQVSLDFGGSGEAFYSPPGRLVEALAEAVANETGRRPELSTGGGTSDARFIHKACPVAELGLKNDTAHKVDEHVAVADIQRLTRIYARAINGFFA